MTKATTAPKVIISNGFNKFHLAVAASSAAGAGMLSRCITGFYPTRLTRRIASLPWVGSAPRVQRFLRREEQIPAERISSIAGPEALHMLGGALRGRRLGSGTGDWCDRASLRAYARRAVRIVEKAAGEGAEIYHYRAGFGHESVLAARKAGLKTVCDHSIAHPSLLAHLVENEGRLPDRPLPDPAGLWGDILADIRLADAVLVNSEFVRATFDAQDWRHSPVHVVYWGIDDQFLHGADAALRERPAEPATSPAPLRIIFAGGFEARKGAETCIEVLRKLGDVDWTLEIAGSVAPSIAERYLGFLSDPRVKLLGWLPRTELAVAMQRARVFLFPSLAEGSARVVFEALACGAYVVTTPNAGSIVEDDVHGALVAPGDVEGMANALRAADADRQRIASIGRANAALVRREYRQSDYWDQLSRLYARIAGGRR